MSSLATAGLLVKKATDRRTDEVDGSSEEGGRRLGPVISDGNTHVSQRRVVFKRVVHVSRHVHDVLDVVTPQTVQVTRRRRVT